MKALENPEYLAAYILFNVLALFLVWAGYTRPRIARFMFFVMFAVAGVANWRLASAAPTDYLTYAETTFFPFYKQFILGWFSQHITITIQVIAGCQALIALGMLLKGFIFKVGCFGAILFLMSIVPFGVGSAFPCTLLMGIAVGAILTTDQGTDYLWFNRGHKFSWTFGIGRHAAS